MNIYCWWMNNIASCLSFEMCKLREFCIVNDLSLTSAVCTNQYLLYAIPDFMSERKNNESRLASWKIWSRRNVGYILDMQNMCFVNCPTEFSQGGNFYTPWLQFNLHLWNNYFTWVRTFGFRIKVNTSTYSWVLNVLYDFVTFTCLWKVIPFFFTLFWQRGIWLDVVEEACVQQEDVYKYII